MECKDRKNHSALMLPHSFLPSMAAEKLRDAADKVCSAMPLVFFFQWGKVFIDCLLDGAVYFSCSVLTDLQGT